MHPLARAARRLPDPVNYHAGPPPLLADPPREIVFFVRRRRMDPRDSNLHTRFLLIVPLEGAGGVVADGRLFRLSPGRAFLVFPRQSHQYAGFEREDILWLFAGFESGSEEALWPLRDRPVSAGDETVRRLGAALAAWSGRLKGDLERAGETGLHLGLALAELLRGAGRRSPAAPPPAPRERAIGRAAACVFRSLERPLPAGEIARAASLSEGHLRRLFRQSFGLGLAGFARQARLGRACGLLHGSDLTITEIAAACGFGSVYAFSRAFRRAFGEPPRDFRKRRPS